MAPRLALLVSLLLPACDPDLRRGDLPPLAVDGSTSTAGTSGSSTGEGVDGSTGQPQDDAGTSGSSGGEGSSTGAASTGQDSTGGTSTGGGEPPEGSSETGAPACLCTPGEVDGCDGAAVSVCGEGCQGFEPVACAEGLTCESGSCVATFCAPGAVSCIGDAVQICDGDGAAYGAAVACPAGEVCEGGECMTACEAAALKPSSIGCSFYAARLENANKPEPSSVAVGNASETHAATVQMFHTPIGGAAEAPQGSPVVVAPGGVAYFEMLDAPVEKVSAARKGGTYRLQSDQPITAFQHSPLAAIFSNDASLLLPEHALARSYVVASYPQPVAPVTMPSYASVIGTAADTVVSWTPPQATLAGVGVLGVLAGETGEATIGRGDFLQVRPVADFGDMSGTVITASAPIWVVGATACANVPVAVTSCDHLEEQLIPLDYWGKRYVGAPSPSRGAESHYWRVYGGEDGSTITTSPPQPGTPLKLDRGQWAELVTPHGAAFIFEGDKPFMPVQYLAGRAVAGTGDPSMYQAIPVEQYLRRYVFATGTGYDVHYAQITRAAGAADVEVDGVTVDGFYPVGDFEVADFEISEGAHVADSAGAFGVSVIGYKAATSYAYPGGLGLAVINPQ